MGRMTTGTIRNTSPVSLGLVTASNTVPPTSSSALRNAIEAVAPTTTCSTVVSVVSRERISPVLVVSKNAGLKPMMWS